MAGFYLNIYHNNISTHTPKYNVEFLEANVQNLNLFYGNLNNRICTPFLCTFWCKYAVCVCVRVFYPRWWSVFIATIRKNIYFFVCFYSHCLFLYYLHLSTTGLLLLLLMMPLLLTLLWNFKIFLNKESKWRVSKRVFKQSLCTRRDRDSGCYASSDVINLKMGNMIIKSLWNIYAFD